MGGLLPDPIKTQDTAQAGAYLQGTKTRPAFLREGAFFVFSVPGPAV